MASTLITGRAISGGIVTPKGRLVYPNLFEPRVYKGETDATKGKYSTKLLLPKEADLSILEAAVEAAIAAAHWPARTKVAKPIARTIDDERWEEFSDEYPAILSASAYGYSLTGKLNSPPTVVFANPNNVCTDETEVYGGRWAVLAVYAKTYAGKEHGASFGLNHVQLLGDDDPIGHARPRASAAFEEQEAEDEGVF